MNLVRHSWKIVFFAVLCLCVASGLLAFSSSARQKAAWPPIFQTLWARLTYDGRRAQCSSILKGLDLSLAAVANDLPAGNAPWPLFGGTPGRNMVNLVDKNVVRLVAIEIQAEDKERAKVVLLREAGGQTVRSELRGNEELVVVKNAQGETNVSLNDGQKVVATRVEK